MIILNANDRAAMDALLRRLLVGAGARLASPDDWAARLDSDSSLARRFVEHLRAEWFEVRAPDDLSRHVTEQVRQHVAAWHPGWPHLWGHIRRVTGTAVHIAAQEGLDLPLVYLAAICHDVAKLDEERLQRSHEVMGAEFAGRVLEGRLPAASIQAIQAAILKQGHDALTYTLSDADKLDKIGAAGVLRRISTATDPGWLPQALERVESDLAVFPPMHFAASEALAAGKRDFLRWFLPLAHATVRSSS